MESLVYWNHAEGRLPVLAALAEAVNSLDLQIVPLKSKSPEECLAEISRARVAVFHGAPDMGHGNPPPAANRDWFCNAANLTRDGFVAVFISTAPISEPNKRVIFDNGVRYVLGVPDTKAANLYVSESVDVAQTAARWRELLVAILDRSLLDSFLQHTGELSGHRSLDDFFGEKVLQEILPALAILCQGYLAVHAVWDDDQKEWTPKAIGPALRQMGWEDMMRGNTQLPNPLLAEQEKKQREVCDRDWWLKVFGFSSVESRIDGDAWQSFGETIAKEWGKGAALPPKLRLLLETLQEPGQIVRPELVAEAYCELAEKLGGQPCPRG